MFKRNKKKRLKELRDLVYRAKEQIGKINQLTHTAKLCKVPNQDPIQQWVL
jgi:hypothetical protein